MTDIARIAPRRIVWKRPPTPTERRQAAFMGRFGPVVFERGAEWLIVESDPREPWLKPLAPDGYKEVLG